ncbi:hypothetical protein K438DRAFT_1981060 [Mycena galopus ATCC 62051]|nr:hypothetical protein K438DRAFT_1981060 [Mycena galopus ATCC 62051]
MGSKCKQCKHRKKHHKKTTITDIVDKYTTQVTSWKASEAAARTETNANFRPKDGKKVDLSKREMFKDKDTIKAKATRVGSVSIITSGLDSNGELQNPHCPGQSKFKSLFSYNLAAVKNEDRKEITFKKTWDQQRIDKWVRGLLLDVFHFLDHHYPENAQPAYHWVLLNKDRLKLYVMKRPIMGELLEEVKATKHKIPSSVYKVGFRTAVERMKLEGNPPSESEAEPLKRKSKRPVKRGRAISSDNESESAESTTEDELEDGAADEIADVATEDEFPVSLSADSGSRAVKEEIYDDDTDLFLKGKLDSDCEEIPPPDKWPRLVKRSRSPGFEEPDRKCMRRDSQTISISDNKTTVSGSPHRSPQLQPATSSFSYLYDPAASNVGVSTSGGHAASDSGSSTAITVSSDQSHLGDYTPFSASIRRYIPPLPREGLHVPKLKHNFWESD